MSASCDRWRSIARRVTCPAASISARSSSVGAALGRVDRECPEDLALLNLPYPLQLTGMVCARLGERPTRASRVGPRAKSLKRRAGGFELKDRRSFVVERT